MKTTQHVLKTEVRQGAFVVKGSMGICVSFMTSAKTTLVRMADRANLFRTESSDVCVSPDTVEGRVRNTTRVLPGPVNMTGPVKRPEIHLLCANVSRRNTARPVNSSMAAS